MIVAAAVCPGPPFLVPGLAPRLAKAVPDLVAACRAAVSSLAGVDRIVAVSTGAPGAAPVAHGPGSLVASSPLSRSDLPVGVQDAVLPRGADTGRSEWWAASWGGDDPADPNRAQVGTIVAAHLLRQAAITVPTTAVELDPLAPRPADQVRALVPDIDEGPSTGLLIIADGAAAHGGDAPAAEDPSADEFDQTLVTVLGDADPAALAGFCRDRVAQAAVLRCESLAAWYALAGLTTDRPPAAGRTTYCRAPFGVGYLVAEWQWRPTG